MKGFKKLVSAFLVVAMVVTLVTITPSTDANAAVTIYSGKKITLTIGKSEKIYLKQKGAKFKTSNKKVATVSSKGVVKAKGIGTCKIKITVGSSSKNSKVTVVPKNVTIKAATLSGTTAKVTWKKVKGVKGYYVYKSTNANSGFKKVATVKGAKKTSATIKNLASGTTYFKVKAFGKSGKKTITSKKYSKAVSVKVWKLVWSDEFNGSSLDMNNWTYETGTGDGVWGNQEWQTYTAGDNAKVENGNLVIIPRMEWKNGNNAPSKVTSTRIITKNKKTFKYGKMEIRAKAAGGKGTWSAGWMLGDGTGDQRGWPYDGEIDIMEAMSGGVPQTIHCERFNNQSWSHGNKNYATGLTQAKSAETYHTYGIIWTDKYIQFTVDGVNKGLYDPSMYDASIYDQCWAFDHPFFFILNCAVGGNAAGEVSTDGWTNKGTVNGVTTWEDYYYVDYVRVYQ